MFKIIKKIKNMGIKKRSLLTSKISMLYSILSTAVKVFLGFFLNNIFFLISGFYSVGTVGIKIIYLMGAKRSKEDQDREIPYFLAMTITQLVTSIVYIIYTTRFFFQQDFTSYTPLMSLAITLFSFIDLGIVIYSLFRVRSKEDLLLKGIKLTNLASAVIFIGITHSALLSLNSDIQGVEQGVLLGIAGLMFGFVNIMISLYMFTMYLRTNDSVSKIEEGEA